MSSELLLLAAPSNTTTYAWGVGQAGRLDNNDNFGPFVKSPSVVTDKNFSIIVSNGSTFLGISGTDLWGWGSGSRGVLGQSNVQNYSSPIQITGSWSKIAIGTSHVLAVKTDNTLWTWGRNDYGQLGLNDRVSRSSPVQVGANTWLDVAAGDSFSIVLRSDDTVWAFGIDDRFQLGQGLSLTGNHRSSPVQVAGGGTYTNVFAGQQTAYAVKTGGTLWGWGANNSSGTPTSYYYLLATGVPTTTNAQSAPVQISSDTGWSKVSNTNATAVAAIKNNELWVWGTNTYGQLGTGDFTTYSSPVQVTGSWLDVHISFSTIGIKSSNELFSWGYAGDFYGLGVNLYPGPTSPVLVNNSLVWSKVAGPLNTTTSGGEQNTAFAITTSGGSNLYGWGSIQSPSANTKLLYGYDTQLVSSPVQIGTQLNKFSKIVANNTATAYAGSYTEPLECNAMGITKSKQVFGWGKNTSGSLGDNSTIPRSSPVLISSQAHTNVALGSEFSVFLREDGTLWSCGTSRRVGTGSTSISSPVQIGSSTNWTFVGAAYSCGYAVNSIGYLYGWGESNQGELANGVSSFYASSPILIGTDYSYVYGGAYSVFAIKTNGTLWSAGSNVIYNGVYNGLLGRGTGFSSSNSLAQITGTYTFPWVKVAVSSYHVLALDSAGDLYGWGGNAYGELGLNNTSSPFGSAQFITSFVTDIAVANQTSYFVKNNLLYSMGLLKTSSLSTVYASSPVLVSSSTNGWKSIATFDDGGAVLGIANP